MEKIIFEDLPSTKTPLNAENLNQLQTNVENAIKKVDNKTIYSTSEQVVGAWIDGKPIYRRVIEIGSLPNNTTEVQPHNIENLEKVINIRSNWYDKVDDNWKNDFRYDSADTKIFFAINKTNLTVEALGTNWTSRTSNCTVTLEYTKTTD